jgi:outer membrane protein OmpA-like peptidoglycan-associated protein
VLRILFLLLFAFLTACASSGVSREAASNMDLGERNAKRFLNVTDNELAETYQNTSQATKGAIIGGTAGAVTGAVYSGIGVIPGTAAGVILGASYGKFIDANTTLEDQLKNRGVNVIVLGDQILIVLPSDRVFQGLTSDIKPQAYSTINLVTQYINSFDKMLVKVSVYTADSGSTRQDMALSKQQARKIEKALIAQGVDARVLYANGYGGTHLVVMNCSDDAQSENYRMEITLEKIVG